MPHQPTTEIRLDGIIACLTPMVPLLNEINDTLGTPFIQAISSTTLSLITAVQNVKRNKTDCIWLMENISGILYALINLHITSETAGSLPPAILGHIGNFTETLHKIHTFLEAQQDGNKIKYFFRQNEMNTIRKDCQVGLDEALKVFKVETSLIMANNIAEMQQKTHNMHQELLELVEKISDGTISDRSSSIYQNTTGSENSSNSFSLLPAQPKIFHGRQSELEDIITGLTQQSAHIAILGAGGIGKTSLARAALHHPQVAAKYEHRFFIAADSVTTSIELANLMGSNLGLKPGKNLTKAVIQFLSRGPPCLLVLDNLETSWEPLEYRGGVEEFLSLLTDVPHLALIITMRGAERPAKVRWTRPFLEPLKPLSYEAARQVFVEIADDFHDSKDIDQLLQLTDNMPLAVNLIAHLVDYEGCSSVLDRWETEKTSLLSIGYDKWSSLDASIVISLASPRMTSGAKDLLSLLSILPDGLSDAELVQCDLPIQDPLGCRATLLRTSLAYCDGTNRLKSLVPIREYIYSFSPPSLPLFHPLCKYFHLLLDLYRKYRGIHHHQGNNARVNEISSNLGNLHQLLLLELHSDNPDLAEAINCTLSLNSFRQTTGHGHTALLDYIPPVFPQPCDHQIEVKYATQMLFSLNYHPIADPEALIHQSMTHVQHLNDQTLELRFYNAVGYYYQYHKNDVSASVQWFEKALSLAKYCGDSQQHFTTLELMARLKLNISDYPAAQMYAQDAQHLAQLSTNLYQEATALGAEAASLRGIGDLKESVRLCERARELLQLCGMQRGQAHHSVMTHLAEVYIQKSDYLEARNIHIQLAQKASAQQDLFYHAFALLNIAEVDVTIGGDVLEVQKNLDNAKKLFSTARSNLAGIYCGMILGDLHLREGDRIAAKDLLQQCLNATWGNDPQVVSYCLERLADVCRWTSNNIDWSYRWPVIFLVHAMKTQEKLAIHKALRFVGDVFISEGDEHTAHNVFTVALEGFTYMDVHRSRADCMLRLGDIAENRGDLVKAVDLWKEARPLFEQSSQAKDMSQIDTRLSAVDQAMLDTPQTNTRISEQAGGTHRIFG
ncbi:hypothetical protein C8R44DRAFT_323921 [Mycena epipterygia]|nr:hypothetical protein C8R44DRAFT_323921 [Mycena epipterygia]